MIPKTCPCLAFLWVILRTKSVKRKKGSKPHFRLVAQRQKKWGPQTSIAAGTFSHVLFIFKVLQKVKLFSENGRNQNQKSAHFQHIIRQPWSYGNIKHGSKRCSGLRLCRRKILYGSVSSSRYFERRFGFNPKNCTLFYY